MTTATATAIGLEVDCPTSPDCREFAVPLLSQLAGGRYDECSVLDLDLDLREWAATHRTARKRAARSERLGYAFSTFQRERFLEDEFAINTSLEHRQGRPMTAPYRVLPASGPDPVWKCPRHAVRRYGAFHGLNLVAYAFVYRAGDLALVSQILGHGDHLVGDVMYLLARGVLEAEAPHGGALVYNRHDSGTDGLRYFKERIGFEPRDVVWRP